MSCDRERAAVLLLLGLTCGCLVQQAGAFAPHGPVSFPRRASTALEAAKSTLPSILTNDWWAPPAVDTRKAVIPAKQLVLRQATVADFPAIAASRHAIFIMSRNGNKELDGRGIDESLLNVKITKQSHIVSRIPFLVAGTAIAFIVVGKPLAAFEEKLVATVDVSLQKSPRRVFFKNLWVDTTYRRQGIAKRLVKRVEQYAMEMGVKTVALEVLVDNVSARRLYESMGYAYDEQSFMDKLYMSWGLGRLTMTKKIS